MANDPIGVIVCKQSMHRDVTNRGYIAMLSVHRNWRKRGIGALSFPAVGDSSVLTARRCLSTASTLVRRSVEVMKKHGVEEVPSRPPHAPRVVLTVLISPRVTAQVVLETEFDNAAALSLYESLGFIREKRLFRFYLNGKDAFRLVLPVTAPAVLRRNNSDASSINSSSSDDVCDEEDLEWEDVGRLIRLRRNVTQLRAAKFVPVWEREDVEGNSAR